MEVPSYVRIFENFNLFYYRFRQMFWESSLFTEVSSHLFTNQVVRAYFWKVLHDCVRHLWRIISVMHTPNLSLRYVFSKSIQWSCSSFTSFKYIFCFHFVSRYLSSLIIYGLIYSLHFHWYFRLRVLLPFIFYVLILRTTYQIISYWRKRPWTRSKSD